MTLFADLGRLTLFADSNFNCRFGQMTLFADSNLIFFWKDAARALDKGKIVHFNEKSDLHVIPESANLSSIR